MMMWDNMLSPSLHHGPSLNLYLIGLVFAICGIKILSDCSDCRSGQLTDFRIISFLNETVVSVPVEKVNPIDKLKLVLKLMCNRLELFVIQFGA
jgi:hypothetical protein